MLLCQNSQVVHKSATHAKILTKKLINQFEIQIAYKQQIHTFNVQTMNIYCIHTVKESSPCLANKETSFFKPCSIKSSL